jgi:tetratricopeptide (TPR) repeat protein
MPSYKTTNTLIIWTMVLCFWLVIIFLDGTFSYQHLFTPQEVVPVSLQQAEVPKIPDAVTLSDVIPTTGVAAMVSDVVHQKLWNSEIFQDLNVLEYLYIKNKNPELLQPLVEKFLQYYQFDKANQYLTLLVEEQGDYMSLKIDPHQVIYTRFHDSTIGLDSVNSLDKVFLLIYDYSSRGMLTQDDQLFYNWLKSLWIYDYASATASFSKITDARYQDFKLSYDSALANFVKIKNPPIYYRDALVALTLLKNWYFSFAKRLALHALATNKNYVLPYQVLAYSNFLTHNRESAKEYFLKLADFDMSNAFLYKFLIGISYYRYGDYEQSILYLNQVTDPGLQIDVYRYMLLWYIKENDTTNMIRIWQNMLGLYDLKPSDFALFFDQMFYIPFRTAKPFALYLDNPQLVDMYIGKCSTFFAGSQADICMYGEVWLQLTQQNLSWMGSKLLSLSEKYHQSHLYHILGDYYAFLKQYPTAKEHYLQALSISDNATEQSILTNKITQIPK